MSEPKHSSFPRLWVCPCPRLLHCWLQFQPQLRGSGQAGAPGKAELGHTEGSVSLGSGSREARAGQSARAGAVVRLEIQLPHSECGQLEASSCQLVEEWGEGDRKSCGQAPAQPHVTGAIGIYTVKPLDAPKWKC